MRLFQSSGSRVAVVFLLASIVQCRMMMAQGDESEARRPKIGLVLSGGGALGVAHVGALRALEELRIPVDCIAGTSMGAVVGGLYASGMSPAELDAWFRDADWHFLLSDSLPRESESFRNKQRQFDVNQGIAFNVSTKSGLKLPAGLVTGRNVMASMRELTMPVRDIRDFDRLPIPFRATATDIETGDLVVLRKGDLVESMRASMSIPGIFTSQPIDGRLLSDGGMASNLPIHVVQEMGAEVIIAIDASEALKKGEELDTASAMANQVVDIFVQRQMREELARLGPGDALVRLKAEDMGATNFAKAAKGIDAGYRQVMEKRAELARFAVTPGQYRQYLGRQRLARERPVMVTSLDVHTPQGEFEHALPEPIDFQIKDHERNVRLQSRINDLGEMQSLDVADYEVTGPEGDHGLRVKTRKTKTGPTDVSFGFGFGYSTMDETDFNLLLAYRMTELNALGAEWSTNLSLGNMTRVVSEWYQPVDSQRRFFLAGQALFGSDFIDGRDTDGERLRFRQQDLAGGLDLGARLWQAGEFRIGYAGGYSEINRSLGVPEDEDGATDRGWVHASLIVDTLDAPNFATRGAYGQVSLIASREELGGEDNYTRLEGQFYKPINFGNNTIVPRVSAALKLGADDVPLYDQVPLGGFLNLSGLTRGSLFGQNSALAELVYYRKLADITPGVGRASYGGFSVETGEVWADPHDFSIGDAVFAGSVFLGADTFLGGLYLGVGMAEGGNTAVYIQLGSLFGQGRYQR